MHFTAGITLSPLHFKALAKNDVIHRHQYNSWFHWQACLPGNFTRRWPTWGWQEATHYFGRGLVNVANITPKYTQPL